MNIVDKIDLRSIWIGSTTASITAFHHQLLPDGYLEHSKIPKAWCLIDMRRSRNVVRMHPAFAHPQHMNFVKHFSACLKLVWDQSELGLQPQSLHFTMICCLGDTQNSRKIPKAWLTWAAIMWWGHIHMHIHSKWLLLIKLIWDQSGLGLQLQSLHFTTINCLGVQLQPTT